MHAAGHSTIRYWSFVSTHLDILFFGVWMLVALVFGMFAQTIQNTVKSGKPPFDIDASLLLYPLIFAIPVFYTFWLVISANTDYTEAKKFLFDLQTAFLHGFFWKTTIGTLKPPAANTAPQDTEAPANPDAAAQPNPAVQPAPPTP